MLRSGVERCTLSVVVIGARVLPVQELRALVPRTPCQAPFAALLGGSLPVCLRRRFLDGLQQGAPARGAARLLMRSRGRFLADLPVAELLLGEQAAQQRRVGHQAAFAAPQLQ